MAENNSENELLDDASLSRRERRESEQRISEAFRSGFEERASQSIRERFEANFGGDVYFSNFPALSDEDKEIKDENEQRLFWAFEMCEYDEEFSIKYIKHFGYNPTLEALIGSSDVQKLERNLADAIAREYNFTLKQAGHYIKKHGVFTVLCDFKTAKRPKRATLFDKILRRR